MSSQFYLFIVLIFSALSVRAQNAPTWTSVQHSTETITTFNPRKIAVAPDGSRYVTSMFSGTLVMGAFTLTGNGNFYLAKYLPNGTVAWVKKYNSSSSQVAVDATGNVYLAGYFNSSLTLETTTLIARNGGRDGYLVKYDDQGVQQWVKQGEASGGFVYVESIATDTSGNAIIVGNFGNSVDFGGSLVTGGGIFMYKFSPVGTVVLAQQVSSNGHVQDMALDQSSNSYLVGSFIGSAKFGNTNLSGIGAQDIFLCKLDASGSCTWAARAGGSYGGSGSSVDVDAGGNPMIVGYCYIIPGNNFNSQAYVARYSSQGIQLWDRQIQSGATTTASAVTYDGRGGYYVTGNFIGAIVFGGITLSSQWESIFMGKHIYCAI